MTDTGKQPLSANSGAAYNEKPEAADIAKKKWNAYLDHFMVMMCLCNLKALFTVPENERGNDLVKKRKWPERERKNTRWNLYA